jgi:hypothetical protein
MACAGYTFQNAHGKFSFSWVRECVCVVAMNSLQLKLAVIIEMEHEKKKKQAWADLREGGPEKGWNFVPS